MKNFYTIVFALVLLSANAQTPFQRVYSTLNTKCQNSSCHSSSATDGSQILKFDGDLNSTYTAIYGVSSTNASSMAKHEKLVKQQHPYYSFLLRKIAGAEFDTDLAIDTATEGALMLDVNGTQLTNKEIEFIRQWIMFGAKKTYSGSDAQPNWGLVNQFYDSLAANGINRFLPKPPKPAVGTGMQLRMGPIFLPITGEIEQEYLERQEVHFPSLPEVNKIEGFMNDQSHHFLLFKYIDSAASMNSAAPDKNNMKKVTLLGATSFDGDKELTASWQNTADLVLPTGTGLFWEQMTVLDMNYHIKNFNAAFVLPTDFYFNIYYKQRSPSTLQMKSELQNHIIGLVVPTGTSVIDYNDQTNNGSKATRYLWMAAGHTHEWGTDFDLYLRDANGQITDKVYDGRGQQTYNGSYYDNVVGTTWDWKHPPIAYWPNLLPVVFGDGNNSGMVSRAAYNNTTNSTIFFSTQTNGEMQLWYYMYTDQPLATSTAINDNAAKGIYFDIMPNPMNSNGKLVYDLKSTSLVDASVMDVTGKVIAQMTNETEEQGVHEVTIGNGEKLASGIYFARLSVNGTVYAKKFIVTE